jgi:hypothetical protein
MRSMTARLLYDGYPIREGHGENAGSDAQPLDFLRLVNVSRTRDPKRRFRSIEVEPPVAFLWERVAGAQVEAIASPGELLRVELELEIPRSQYAFRWSAWAGAGADGRVRLRVPYATDRPNGETIARSARWTLGARGGALAIASNDVEEGLRVELPGASY